MAPRTLPPSPSCHNFGVRIASWLLVVLAGQSAFPAERITKDVEVIRGPVNGVRISRGGKSLAIYGDPRENPPPAEKVLFTHYRRDVVWAGRELAGGGAEAVYPGAEEPLFTGVREFWSKYSQFHDYAAQSTRVLTMPIPRGHAVWDGDRIDWNFQYIDVHETPGYTRGAVSYFFQANGKRIACVGDLIYGDGRILDLFSLQDAIPEAKEDGYHGYAARAAQVIESLRAVAAWNPDVVIPARGPVIYDPQDAIARLISRLQNVFSNYFAISALRHYRGDEKMRIQAKRVLGEWPVDWMETAKTADEPEWLRVIGNTRVIVSESGGAFVVDCGTRRQVDAVKQMLRDAVIKKVEGIWVTHYHDDHTNFVQTAAQELGAPVFATAELQDILQNPGAYKMPCLTANPIREVKVVKGGTSERWHEFEFSYSYFPGQTLYHDALLVKKDGGASVLLVGDSFTPTGIDDYCVLNRNFSDPEPGFAECLRYIREKKPDWLVNQHVNPAFHFSDEQIDTMLANLKARRKQLSELLPWDDPNFGVDAQWARFSPYRSSAVAGSTVRLKVVVLNHSPRAQKFLIRPHVPEGWRVSAKEFTVRVGGRQTGEVEIPVVAGGAGLGVVTADIAVGEWETREWMEALVDVR